MLKPMWELRDSTTRQFSTFNPANGEKFRRVPPGESAGLALIEGPGCITRMWITFPGWFWQYWDPDHPVDPTLLRTTILRIYWDGSDSPSIESPVGDLFGVGHCEYRHYTSRFLGMSSGGFYTYLPMPFEQMRMEVQNLHDSIDLLMFANITYELFDRLPTDAGRLHCQFMQRRNPGAEPVEILNAKGRGHFVGCCLSIQGRDPNYLAFLEAPEHIYIDSESDHEPTIVGTGLEDYFNGGWYFRDQEFCAPLHGVPLKDPLRSMVSMYRFHEQDALAFRKSIDFRFINPWAADRLKPFIYSSTAYWYQERPAAPAVPLPDANSLRDLYRIRDVDHQSIP